jgi:hypothetical protein
MSSKSDQPHAVLYRFFDPGLDLDAPSSRSVALRDGSNYKETTVTTKLSKPEPSLLPGRRLGSIIGAVFGIVYIEVNASSLPVTLMLILRILGAAVFLLVLISMWLEGPQPSMAHEEPPVGLDARFWLIVALEAAGIVAGSAVLRAVGLGSATVAWVSVVVGIHFLALAAVWRVSVFRPLGTAIALCGASAIAAATVGAGAAWVGILGGVLPGGLLLYAATRRATTVLPSLTRGRGADGCPRHT